MERLYGITRKSRVAAGTLVWLVFPETRTLEVHQVGQPVHILTEKDTLNGSDVLVGFQLSVREFFAELDNIKHDGD